MLALDSLAEKRIREAQKNGEFDDLPGSGAPLALDDNALVPEELRVAYRMLKNAGFVPPELDAHREIRDLEQLLQRTDDEGERGHILARIHFLLGRRATAKRDFNLCVESVYFERIAEKLARGRTRS